MQIWAETGKSALPIRNYSHILYQFLMFTQNLKRSRTGQDIADPWYTGNFDKTYDDIMEGLAGLLYELKGIKYCPHGQ